MPGESVTVAERQAARTSVRFWMLSLLTTGTMINYLDRAIMGVAAPVLSKDLGLDAAMMGIVFSAFSWTYAAAQIPGGAFIDRFGSKLTYCLSIVTWSLFTLLQGFATGFGGLLFLRGGLGICEAPCFPTNGRIVSTWFPQKERAKATGIYTVGEYIGLAFLSPVLFWIMARFGWHVLFFLVGAIGMLFGVAWWLAYREPTESRSVNQAELDYISAGGGLSLAPIAKEPFSWANLGRLLKHRQVWGASIGQFAGNSTLVFFVTWFPTYLATERHLGWVRVGFYSFLPFIAAGIGVLVGGWVSDRLLTRTGSANLARKLPIIAGLVLASTIISANFMDNNALIIAALSVAFFGQGMVGLGWVVISDIAPKRLMGLTGGFYSFTVNLSGIITPIVIGLIVARTGSFHYALIYTAACAIVGIFFYWFVLGDIHRLEVDMAEPADTATQGPRP